MKDIIIKDIKMVGSYPSVNQCPKRLLPEYAFIGRSNVGKSSLINMLTARKSLARVSNTPGKTQLINYFLINDSWYLVDLPGYGFAKISKSKRREWEKMIDRYLTQRSNLVCVFELIDSRHKLQQIDLEFINWLGEMNIPFAIAYTKVDKIQKVQLNKHLRVIRDEILESWHEMPKEFVTSAEKHVGRQEILQYIDELNKKVSPLFT